MGILWLHTLCGMQFTQQTIYDVDGDKLREGKKILGMICSATRWADAPVRGKLGGFGCGNWKSTVSLVAEFSIKVPLRNAS